MFELLAYRYLLLQHFALVTMPRMNSKTTVSADSQEASAEEVANLAVEQETLRYDPAINEGTLFDDSDHEVAETDGGLGEVLTV